MTKHCSMISLKFGRFSGLFSELMATSTWNVVVATDEAEGCVSHSQKKRGGWAGY